MTKDTSTSLLKELLKFLKDTPIETELAFIYKFDDDCLKFQEKMSEEDFLNYCKQHANIIAIFEGSWEEDNISDLNNIMPKYVEGWYKTKITISKEEYDALTMLKEENIRLKQAVDEADDLIKSHLTPHYNRKWENYCKNIGVEL